MRIKDMITWDELPLYLSVSLQLLLNRCMGQERRICILIHSLAQIIVFSCDCEPRKSCQFANFYKNVECETCSIKGLATVRNLYVFMPSSK